MYSDGMTFSQNEISLLGLVRFEVVAAVRMAMLFWVLTQCRLVGIYLGRYVVLSTNLHGVKTQKNNIIC
jgi:hypothetical protein